MMVVKNIIEINLAKLLLTLGDMSIPSTVDFFINLRDDILK